MADDKSYIIDPLTSICKVALLHFMPEKTKLAINHHVLYVQGYSYYQWLERMKNGDSRIDISNLNMPFLKAIRWYIIDCPEKVSFDAETDASIKSITSFAIEGLRKLQNSTYQKDPAIKIILQYLINLLTDAINNTWNENSYVRIENNGNILSDKIKNNFDIQMINSIAKMLNDAERVIDSSSSDVSALIDCAHKLLINRDNTFQKMMKEVNTTL